MFFWCATRTDGWVTSVKCAFLTHFASITIRDIAPDILFLSVRHDFPPSARLDYILQQTGACGPPEVLFIIITGEEHNGDADVFTKITKTVEQSTPSQMIGF